MVKVIVEYETLVSRVIEPDAMFRLRRDGNSYKEIAVLAGISRQRVQQLLSPDKQTREMVLAKHRGCCARCGIFIGECGHIHHRNIDTGNYNKVENLQLLCTSCHRKEHSPLPKFECQQCGKPIRRGSFCSHVCVWEYKGSKTVLTCSHCGKEFTVLTSQAKHRIKRNKTGLIFCARRCLGHWNGIHNGFGKKPI